MDEGARLEIVYPEWDRGFESRSLRVPRFQRKGGTRGVYRRVRMIFNTPWLKMIDIRKKLNTINQTLKG